jgi:hypothetical protein
MEWRGRAGITVKKVGMMQPSNGVYITQPALVMTIYRDQQLFNKHWHLTTFTDCLPRAR